MNLSDILPKHRIEIRRAGSRKNEPWEIAELAHTEHQITVKLPYWKNNPDLETRVVVNLPAAPQPVRLAPEVAAASPAAEPVVVPSPVRVVKAAPIAVSQAPAPEMALPFKTGDRLQDKNVAAHAPLLVAEENPDGRHGFNVELQHEDQPHQKWFVPIGAAGSFHLHGSKAAPSATPGARKSAARKRAAAKASPRRR